LVTKEDIKEVQGLMNISGRNIRLHSFKKAFGLMIHIVSLWRHADEKTQESIMRTVSFMTHLVSVFLRNQLTKE